jgi:hypothetical protein
VWSLADYARKAGESRALRVAIEVAERHFGTKSPPSPAEEPCPDGAMFDFLSTSATRALAVSAAQGATPFVGAWLRERVLPVLPRGFVARKRDENPWNASVAWLLGSGYTLTHDEAFLESYFAVVQELDRRDGDSDAAIGRDATFPEAETLSTWAFALAMDALGG